jgi:photosystem II stability/assembly factor-like uncharacterized protein
MRKAILTLFVLAVITSALPVFSQWNKHVDSTYPGCGLFDIQFINDLTGYVVGYNYNSQGYILKTTNKGGSWELVPNVINDQLFCLSFSNEMVGYAAGFHSVIQTIDGGNTWNNCTPALSGTFFFSDVVVQKNVVWLVGVNDYDGIVMKSIDNGNSWSTVARIPQQQFRSIVFYEQYGVIAGQNSVYLTNSKSLVTNDFGSTWQIKNIDCRGYEAGFNSQGDMFIGGADTIENAPGLLLKSQDHGQTWSRQLQTDAWMWCQSIVFSGNNGWLNAGGGIYETNDNGLHWEKIWEERRGPDRIINFADMSLRGSDGIALVGWTHNLRGAILLHEIPLGINSNEIIPKTFKLFQNYPNPFNPSTMISFSLPKKSNVHITLYDIAGKEIEELFNGVKEAGNHEIRFDGTNLSSGVYFYKLTAGDFSQTKKMMFVK